MITSRKGSNGRFALLFLICLALIAYFSYHAIEGDHGLHKRTELAHRIAGLTKELEALKAERQRIEHDVALITSRAKSQPDLLDEQARRLLNYANTDDIIVLRSAGSEEK